MLHSFSGKEIFLMIYTPLTLSHSSDEDYNSHNTMTFYDVKNMATANKDYDKTHDINFVKSDVHYQYLGDYSTKYETVQEQNVFNVTYCAFNGALFPTNEKNPPSYEQFEAFVAETFAGIYKNASFNLTFEYNDLDRQKNPEVARPNHIRSCNMKYDGRKSPYIIVTRETNNKQITHERYLPDKYKNLYQQYKKDFKEGHIEELPEWAKHEFMDKDGANHDLQHTITFRNLQTFDINYDEDGFETYGEDYDSAHDLAEIYDEMTYHDDLQDYALSWFNTANEEETSYEKVYGPIDGENYMYGKTQGLPSDIPAHEQFENDMAKLANTYKDVAIDMKFVYSALDKQRYPKLTHPESIHSCAVKYDIEKSPYIEVTREANNGEITHEQYLPDHFYELYRQYAKDISEGHAEKVPDWAQHGFADNSKPNQMIAAEVAFTLSENPPKHFSDLKISKESLLNVIPTGGRYVCGADLYNACGEEIRSDIEVAAKVIDTYLNTYTYADSNSVEMLADINLPAELLNSKEFLDKSTLSREDHADQLNQLKLIALQRAQRNTKTVSQQQAPTFISLDEQLKRASEELSIEKGETEHEQNKGERTDDNGAR